LVRPIPGIAAALRENEMDQLPPETPQKKVYVEPTLEEREHVDEVVWGQFATTTGKQSG
jgi:hypothetical protein